MALGLPLTLLIAVFVPGLWAVGAGWIAAVAGAVIVDFLLAAKSARADVGPLSTIYIGEGETVAVDVDPELNRSEIRLSANENLRITPKMAQPVYGRASFGIFALRRGDGRLHRIWVRWTGPLGLIWRQEVGELDRAVAVTPNTRLVKDVAAELFDRDAGFGLKIQRDRGEGTEFDSLVEFQTGMDRRAIDWKHSARHGALHAKEYRTERNHRIVFAIDSGHLMSEPQMGEPDGIGVTRLDRAINASLLMGYVSLKFGDRVGYFGFDETPYLFTPPVAGVQRFAHLQALTSQIEYSFNETNFTLGLSTLSQRLSRRSLIIVFTDFVDTTSAELMVENIARLMRKHLVVFVAFRDEVVEELITTKPETTEDISRAVVAESLARERDLVIAQLVRLGVQVVDAPASEMSLALLNRFLDIKRRELL